MPDLNPKFLDLPTFSLAGIRRFHTFADAIKTIPDQWHDLRDNPLPGYRDAKITYGVTSQMDMPNQRFEYLAGYEVADFDDIPTDARMIVPSAHYAVFELNTVMEIRPFWAQFFDGWLPASGRQLADAPNFERYDESFNDATRGPLEI